MGRRENTFRIDFSRAPKSPSYEEIHKFIAQKLGLTRDNVLLIQPNRRIGCVFVEVNDLELAHRIVEEHNEQHEMKIDETTYKIPIEMEDGAVEVRILDLPRSVTAEQIAEFLGGYGEVLSIRELLWDEKYFFSGTPTGVRIARVIVESNIPSSVTIGGHITCLSYKGQRQTCPHCNEFVHNGIPCVQNKKLLVQKFTADKLSYANVAKLPTSANTNRTTQMKSTTNTTKPQTVSVDQPTIHRPQSLPRQVQVEGPMHKKPKHVAHQMLPPSHPKPTTSFDITDGESDCSQSSLRSRLRERPPNKKTKPNDGDGSQSEGHAL